MIDERKHVIVLDNDLKQLNNIDKMLCDRYKVSLVSDSDSFFRMLEMCIPDVVLIDTSIKDMNCLKVYEKIMQDERLRFVSVVFMLKAYQIENENRNHTEDENDLMQISAFEYILKPFTEKVLKARLERILEIKKLRESFDSEVEKKTKLCDTIAYQSMLTVANTIDAKELYSKGHSRRVAEYSQKIARVMGLSKEKQKTMYHIGLMHDVGKIAIPDDILNKTGPLTPAEKIIVQKHASIGGDILGGMTMIEGLADGVRHHHERYDGTGYPARLKGEDIPLYARIVCVADCYDAMVSARSYKKGIDKENAKQELIRQSGSHFDPKVVEAFLTILDGKVDFKNKNRTVAVIPGEKESEDNALLKKVYSKNVIEIANNVFKDTFTGFWNRNYMEDEINIFLKDESNRGALFVLELSRFRTVKEEYGLVACDKLVMLITEIIKPMLNDEMFACRVGSDQFVVFFKNETRLEELSIKAQDIIDRIVEKKVEIDINNISNACIGIAVTDEYISSYNLLYQGADRALYHIKQGKENGFYFYNESYKEKLADNFYGFVDLKRLISYLSEEPLYQNDFKVELGNYLKIFNFISKYIERCQTGAQLLLYTVIEKEVGRISDGELSDALQSMQNIVIGTVRKGDVTTIFSSHQILVILMDVNAKNAQQVSQKIMKRFGELPYYDNLNVYCEQQYVTKNH